MVETHSSVSRLELSDECLSDIRSKRCYEAFKEVLISYSFAGY